MRALIISDTHGKEDGLKAVLSKIHPVDRLIHCGDMGGRREAIARMAGCPCIFVRGNCDFDKSLDREAVVFFEGLRIFVTHGHMYHVRYSNDELIRRALELNCSIVLCGHTHVPEICLPRLEGGITVVNPGSLSEPRQGNRLKSFVVMETDRSGKPHFTLAYLTWNGEITFS